MKKFRFFIFYFLMVWSCVFYFSSKSHCQHPVVYGLGYFEYKLAKTTSVDFFVYDTIQNTFVSVGYYDLNAEKIISQIESLALTDKNLILRVLKMHASDNQKLKEILHLTVTYNEIECLVLQAIYTTIHNK